MSVDLVFDLDGTISNPAVGIGRSMNYALSAQGFAEVADDRIAGWIGPPLEAALADLAGTNDARVVTALVASYRERYADLGYAENVLYDGIPSVLAELRRSGRRLGVCTSKRTDFAEKILAMFELDGLFEFVDGGDIGVAKASQLAGLLDRGAIGSDAVMIGDRAVDIRAAKANDLPSLGVTWGFGGDGELEDAGADSIVSEPSELKQLLPPAWSPGADHE